MGLTILKHLFALALSIGIVVLGYHCAEVVCLTNKHDMTTKETIKWFIYFFAVYIIIIRPVCDYWLDKISNWLNIKKN